MDLMAFQSKLCILDGTVAGWRQWKSVVAQGLLLAVGAGCASMSGSPALTTSSTPDVKVAVVENRAESRWKALIDGDLDKAYAFLSPGSRSAMNVDEYKKQHRIGFYRGVKLQSADCNVEVCTVKLMLTYDFKTLKGIVTPVTEKWIIEQGQAWYVEQR